MDILNLFVEPFIRVAPKLPEAVIDIFVGYIAIKIIVWTVGKTLKVVQLPKLRGIILSLLKLGLWIILFAFIANSLGFDKLVVAISGSVLVLAFILNTGIAPLITDVVSGIFLCTDRDFKVGSRIKIGNGESAVEGILKEVDMRKVRILDDDNNIVVVPNSVMDKDKWVVLERKDSVIKSKAQEKARIAKENAKRVIKNKLNK